MAPQVSLDAMLTCLAAELMAGSKEYCSVARRDG